MVSVSPGTDNLSAGVFGPRRGRWENGCGLPCGAAPCGVPVPRRGAGVPEGGLRPTVWPFSPPSPYLRLRR